MPRRGRAGRVQNDPPTRELSDVTNTSRAYRIRIRGVAGDPLRAAFDDVDVSTEAGSTLLRTELVDTATLYGLIRRIESFGLVLMNVEAIDEGQPARADEPSELP